MKIYATGNVCLQDDVVISLGTFHSELSLAKAEMQKTLDKRKSYAEKVVLESPAYFENHKDWLKSDIKDIQIVNYKDARTVFKDIWFRESKLFIAEIDVE